MPVFNVSCANISSYSQDKFCGFLKANQSGPFNKCLSVRFDFIQSKSLMKVIKHQNSEFQVLKAPFSKSYRLINQFFFMNKLYFKK